MIGSLDILEEKITVTYTGLSAVFDTICSDERLEVVLKKYDLERCYVYHGGGFEMRKNGKGVLRAYKFLISNSQFLNKSQVQNFQIPKLVISVRAHAKNNPLAFDVEGLIKKLGLEEQVQLLVFVPEEPQRAHCWIRRGLAEAAKAGVLDHVAKLFKFRQITSVGFALQNLFEQVVHLHGAGAARDALAALFVDD